jgi:hypothetical protein
MYQRLNIFITQNLYYDKIFVVFSEIIFMVGSLSSGYLENNFLYSPLQITRLLTSFPLISIISTDRFPLGFCFINMA